MKKQVFQVLLLFSFISGLQAQNLSESKGEITEKNTKESFYANAKKAGLTETKTKELLKIIAERNQVLKDLEAKKKQTDTPYSIQDQGTLYNFKINNARNYYAQKINGLLTYNEYGDFSVENYRNEATENTNLEYLPLIKANADLTESQKKSIYTVLYQYYINQYLTTAYYSYDKTLQKPKLGILRFNFEKEFKKLYLDYKIKPSESSGGNTNSFEWNKP